MVEAAQLEGDEKGPGMSGLIRELLRPYRGSLAVILVAMLVQSTMTLAAPWPLKIVIDNVVVGRKLDPWLAHLIEPVLAHAHRAHLAEIAALAVILIAVFNAVASYMANYFTESVGQWVANDLRMRTYHHLQYLSLRYYDSHQSGVLLSTITADVLTIQNFASSATLGIVVDMFTILGMLVVMFFLNWDFTLIAVAITPLLLLLAYQVQEGGQELNPRGAQAAEQHRGCGAAGSRVHPGGHGLRQTGTGTANTGGGERGDRSCGAQSPPGQGAAFAHRFRHRLLLRCLRPLARLAAYPYGRDDRRGVDRFSFLSGLIFQAGERPCQYEQLHRPDSSGCGAYSDDSRRRRHTSRETRCQREDHQG